ncbi:MAG: DUF2000 family protein [Pseudomonadota bacterium]
MNQRVAIVTLGTLERGEVANVAAILCGQVSRTNSRFFNEDTVKSKDALSHAAPNYSVVILKAKNTSQLAKLANENTEAICFSRIGQKLNNAFPDYEAAISSSNAKDAEIIGVVVYGEDVDVRDKTRKFSLMT